MVVSRGAWSKIWGTVGRPWSGMFLSGNIGNSICILGLIKYLDIHWVPNLYLHIHLSVGWGLLRLGVILRQPLPLPVCAAYPVSSKYPCSLHWSTLWFSAWEQKSAQNLTSHSCLPIPDYFPLLKQSTSLHPWLWLCWVGVSGQRGVCMERWLESHERNVLLSGNNLTNTAMNEELQVSVLPIFKTQYLLSCILGGGAASDSSLFLYSIPLYYCSFWPYVGLWR